MPGGGYEDLPAESPAFMPSWILCLSLETDTQRELENMGSAQWWRYGPRQFRRRIPSLAWESQGWSAGGDQLPLWTSLVAQTIKSLPPLQTPGFDPWIRKIPWRRKWQPTPVFLPGESHGQRSLVGYMRLHRVGHDWMTNTFTFIFLLEDRSLNWILKLSKESRNPEIISWNMLNITIRWKI